MTRAVGAPLAARELPVLFSRVHRELAGRRKQIDDLNVFPVPDGDTGTNMVLTVQAGLEALHAARRGHRVRDVDDLAREVIRGVVRGARGNSGVIISQVIRAVVEVVTGHDVVDASLYAEALVHGHDLAYDAVAEPVEGTMLSAIAAAAAAAEDAASRGADLASTSAAACAATAVAVERTREQLAVLAEAGVVDAGARGFEVLLAAVHRHLSGEQLDVVVDAPRGVTPSSPGGCDPSLAHPYEVQYLLDADDATAAALREGLESIGDSVVVVAAGGLLKVHIHTATVGAAIEAGMAHGVPSRLEVVDLSGQIRDRTARSADEAAAEVVELVAWARGEGLVRLLEDVGVSVVRTDAVPTSEDFLAACGGRGASMSLVLPGDTAAVPAARRATEAVGGTGPRVSALTAADSPLAVLVAASVRDPHGAVDDVLTEVGAAVAGLSAAEIILDPAADTAAWAVRIAGRVAARLDDPAAAVRAACVRLSAADADVVTLLHGAESTLAEQQAAASVVGELAPYAQFEPVDAGVCPALFWIGVE